MKTTLAILLRELSSYFFSPLAWVLLTLFLIVQGYSFFLFMELLSQPYAPHGAVMQHFFGGSLLFWIFLIFIVSALTMRLVAEERRSRTIESLMTAPVTEAHVILGKYLASIIFYCFLWVPTLLFVVIVAWLSSPVPVDPGPIFSGYLGTLMIGCTYLAIGLLCSALSKSQIVAAVLTFTTLSLFLLAGVMGVFVRNATLKAIIEHINLFKQMEDFSRGIVDSRPLVLYLCVIVFCLLAATKALEAKKWR